MNIRTYKQQDYKMLSDWFTQHKMGCPDALLFSEQSTFIVSNNEQDLACMTLYLTNCKGLSIMENFVGNPASSKEERNKATRVLVEFCYDYLKSLGYKNVLGFALNEKLEKHYSDLGMTSVNKNIISVMRSL